LITVIGSGPFVLGRNAGYRAESHGVVVAVDWFFAGYGAGWICWVRVFKRGTFDGGVGIGWLVSLRIAGPGMSS